MNKISLFIVACLVASFVCSVIGEEHHHPAHKHFHTFVQRFKKNYHSEHERSKRFQIFAENMKRVEHYNKHSKGATYAINHFADLTSEEWVMKVLRPIEVRKQSASLRNMNRYLQPADKKMPDSFDWVERGAVTAVQDQGMCGSCWTFATAAVLETQHYLDTGKLVQLSNQQLLDCDQENDACQGGWYFNAWEYVRSAGGLMASKDYPYTARPHSCQFDKKDIVANVTNIYQPLYTEPEDLAYLVYKYGVWAAALHVKEDFQFYSSGVYRPAQCNGEINHAVTVVGYGKDSKGYYFKVKNSWSALWGEDGYFKIGADLCSISNYWGIATE
eukprot:TRINITY_DN613_c0_g1_i1.p1 TRINITY_DN613_c0_g1~~TRINITY_DN613_c0_g1_i1.p1  ORF type:complete len:352 (-),score=157.48 TRINITY_DN613_c0_g1_i1:57-1046(-)